MNCCPCLRFPILNAMLWVCVRSEIFKILYFLSALNGRVAVEPLYTACPPGNRARRYGHRGAAFDVMATGVPIYTACLTGVDLYGMVTWESLSTVGLPRSRSLLLGHRGVIIYVVATGEPSSTIWSPGSHSLRHSHTRAALKRERVRKCDKIHRVSSATKGKHIS